MEILIWFGEQGTLQGENRGRIMWTGSALLPYDSIERLDWATGDACPLSMTGEKTKIPTPPIPIGDTANPNE